MFFESERGVIEATEHHHVEPSLLEAHQDRCHHVAPATRRFFHHSGKMEYIIDVVFEGAWIMCSSRPHLHELIHLTELTEL